jgi:hypothetical protein
MKIKGAMPFQNVEKSRFGDQLDADRWAPAAVKTPGVFTGG